MPTQHSRLSHVLGVLALVAYFRPEDQMLRLAALLHDVGHGPFSHSSEALPGFDHHEAGREIILDSEVGVILRRYGVDPAQMVALTEGQPSNPVRTQTGLLHLDHLDFFVRDPFACGWHQPLPADILSRLYLDRSNVAADLSTAEHLVERILFEHQLFTTPVKVAGEALLGRLLLLGSQKGILKADWRSIAALTDGELLARLEQAGDPENERLLDRLLRRSHLFAVRRLEPDEPVPPGALVVHYNQPYLAEPLVEGQAVSRLSEKAEKNLAQARALLGTYVVSFSDEGVVSL